MPAHVKNWRTHCAV